MNFSPKKLENLPVYQDPSGYWARPTLRSGNRHWRKLDAKELVDAIVEFKDKAKAHDAFLSGTSTTSPWEENTETFAGLSKTYIAARCPNSEDQPRNKQFCDLEAKRIGWLNQFYGDKHPNDIRFKDLMPYAKWRMQQCKRGDGERMVELEWCTLSNVQKFGMSRGVVELAWVRHRPKLRSDNSGSIVSKKIRHARDVAPRNGDDVHVVAAELMKDPRSEALAWMWLFACLTGLRKSELLRLRVDATDPSKPGYVDERSLYVRRSKRSKKTTVELHPDLEELIHAHFTWHQRYAPGNPFFFPCRAKFRKEPLDPSALVHALKRVCQKLKLPHFTPHGGRAFFATVLRAQGMGEAEIASRIGDKTVRLIQDCYGGDPFDHPESFTFRPSVGLPVWKTQVKETEKVNV